MCKVSGKAQRLALMEQARLAELPPPAPAPAPAPAAPTAIEAQGSPESVDFERNDAARAKKRGRAALRIPLSMGGTGGGAGINLPVG